MTTELAREVVDAVREAGRAVEEVRREGFDVEEKQGQGPVTRADRGADDLLRDRLTGLREPLLSANST